MTDVLTLCSFYTILVLVTCPVQPIRVRGGGVVPSVVLGFATLGPCDCILSLL
jgi:hypothetical protein